MEKYFEIRNKEGFKYGMIENIPEDVTTEMVAERIETDYNNETIILVGDKDERIDIIFDWASLDFDGGIDENIIVIDEVLQASIVKGIEDKVVFTALTMVKKDNSLDIVIAMQNSYRKLTE